MPDKYLLPSDQADREKLQLQEEVNQLKMRLPVPEVAFEDGNKIHHISKGVPQEPIVDDTWTDEEREYCLIQEEALIMCFNQSYNYKKAGFVVL